MSSNEKEIEKIYFKASDVAQETNLSVGLIRDWCDYFEIKTARGPRNVRKFTQKDIDLIKEINSLIYDEGYTRRGAKLKIEIKKGRKPNN